MKEETAQSLATRITILVGIFTLVTVWSIWVFVNFPPQNQKIESIGFMECWNESGVGPTYKCGNQIVKCYSERGGERVMCPFFEHLY